MRTLDAAIAEHVYGHHVVWSRPEQSARGDIHQYLADVNGGAPIPAYSTDIALAIGVLEHLRKTKGKMWNITANIDFQVSLGAKDFENSIAYVVPLPEAICRHILHVLGVEGTT